MRHDKQVDTVCIQGLSQGRQRCHRGLVMAQDARPDLSILKSRTRPGNVSPMNFDSTVGLGTYLEPLTQQLRKMNDAFCDLRFSQVPG